MGHHRQLNSFGPAQAFPEFNTSGIVFKDEEMTFLDPDPGQGKHAAADQGLPQSLSPELRVDHQVMDVPPTSVMTAEDRAHQFTFLPGRKTHTRVAFQELSNAVFGVCLAEPDVVTPLPQTVDLLIVLDRHFMDIDCAHLPLLSRRKSSLVAVKSPTGFASEVAGRHHLL